MDLARLKEIIRPKKYLKKNVKISGMKIDVIKREIQNIPDDATLTVHDQSWEHEDPSYVLWAEWTVLETDEEYEARLKKEDATAKQQAEERAIKDRETYERLRKQYGDVVEVEVSRLNEEARKMINNEPMWQRYREWALSQGIKIIGEANQ